jgi:hypothetical protein
LVTIDQLAYYTPDLRTNIETNIPFVGDSKATFHNIGAGKFKESFLMGTFTLPPLVT